eukprot:COSAG05_NODE_2445_length_3058_cov_1.736735_2_plen_322_part_00
MCSLASCRDEEFLWIAEEALAQTSLPSGWTEYLDADGRAYYNHPQMAESTYENPIDTYHKALFQNYNAESEVLRGAAANAFGGGSSSNSGGAAFFHVEPSPEEAEEEMTIEELQGRLGPLANAAASPRIGIGAATTARPTMPSSSPGKAGSLPPTSPGDSEPICLCAARVRTARMRPWPAAYAIAESCPMPWSSHSVVVRTFSESLACLPFLSRHRDGIPRRILVGLDLQGLAVEKERHRRSQRRPCATQLEQALLCSRCDGAWESPFVVRADGDDDDSSSTASPASRLASSMLDFSATFGLATLVWRLPCTALLWLALFV